LDTEGQTRRNPIRDVRSALIPGNLAIDGNPHGYAVSDAYVHPTTRLKRKVVTRSRSNEKLKVGCEPRNGNPESDASHHRAASGVLPGTKLGLESIESEITDNSQVSARIDDQRRAGAKSVCLAPFIPVRHGETNVEPRRRSSWLFG
jgi:hypothetical protein